MITRQHEEGSRKIPHGGPAALFIVLTMLLSLTAALARTHLVYDFDRSRGLDTTGIVNLTQDRDGFLWIGGFLSLFRYDGREFHRWNHEPLAGNPEGFADDLLEGLIVKLAFPSRELFRVTDDGFEPYQPSISPPLENVQNIAASADGSLWICDDVGLRHRNANRVWRTIPQDDFDGVRPHRLQTTPDGGILVLTGRHLWRVSPGAKPRFLITAQNIIVAAEETKEGRIYLAYGGPPGGTLAELVNGELKTLAARGGRATDLVVRNDSIWVAFDNGLMRWHPTEGIETILNDGGFYTGGGRFELDHENSLWIGGFANLVLIPEADTSVWMLEDGLAQISFSWAVEGADGIWAASYNGIDLIRLTDEGLKAQTALPGFSPFKLCTDGAGRLWHIRKVDYTQPAEIYEYLSGHEIIHTFGDNKMFGTCAPSSDGRVWINRDHILYKTEPDGGEPVVFANLPDHGRVQSLYETRSGELWIGFFEKTCHTAVTSLGDDTASWLCTDEKRITWSRSMVETEQGDLWIDSSQGLLRWTGESWEWITGLPTGQIYHLVPSPRGGIWIAAKEYIVRVLPVPDDPAQVSVVERLTMWQGLPNETGSSVVEQENGTLWIATRRGLVQVPAEVRDQSPPVPRVELVDVIVDGRSLSLRGDNVSLPYRQNRVEVHFAAMSYRNPGLIQYRVRSRADEKWRETRTPEFRFVELAPGDYRPEVAASLDGLHWSEVPAGFSFTVRAPWYATLWAFALYVLFVTAILWTIYRVRLAMHLRAERQRTRIAMDLHDEMGSGLGSIGILSGVLRSGNLETEDQQGVIRQIEQSAEELGAALADIVWSLRPRAHTLGAVFERVEKLGRRLLPHPQVDLEMSVDSDHQQVVVSQPVCKNVLSIATEALHNAAKHGKPDKLSIALMRDGKSWLLLIQDNGAGFLIENEQGDGLGLQSMRRRARDIGAELTLLSQPGEGTKLRLAFHPLGKGKENQR